MELKLTKGKATREAYGSAILELGKGNPDIYVVDCDIGKSCKTVTFSQELPNQHVNVGIAEQNACGVAAGLATCGKIPFVTTYAVFGSMRMLEQIRQEVCYPKLNVKIACSHGGFTPASDGASLQGIEDYGLFRTIPNMTILTPGDYNSTYECVKLAAEFDGPVYLRFTRDPVPTLYPEGYKFEIGKANILNEGTDITIITTGDILAKSTEACIELEKLGISTRLIDMFTVKPLDKMAIEKAIKETKGIITVEDHNIINGLGSAVAEVVAESDNECKFKRVGIQDQFGESAPYESLLKKNNITVEYIVATAKKMLEK
ncbi:MAG: transketolase family protein [Spirochaetaceae bacterium]|nr:transketolase family protein [Spirochaetaceae bacterium]